MDEWLESPPERPEWHAKVYGLSGAGRSSKRRRHNRKPRQALAKKLLDQFGWACGYCGVTFGGHQSRPDEAVVAVIQWDHFRPWSYVLANPDDNWVPSCQVCNDIKNALMFETLEEARTHVMRRRVYKGWVVR